MPLFCRQQPDRPRTRSVVSVVFLSVIFGFAAGVVGMLLAAVYLVPEPLTAAIGPTLLTRGRTTAQADKGLERVAAPAEASARSLVLFYPAKGPERAQVAGREIFLPGEAIGAGMVLTSDGWVVTHSQMLSGRPAKAPSDIIAVIGAKRYPVKNLVVDGYSGVVFAKVDAINLPVVSFGDSDGLAAGDSVFAFDASRGPRRLDVIGLDDRPAAGPADLVRSSERLQKVLRLSSSPGPLPGSMLLDRQGDVMGVYVGEDGIGAYAVPFGRFSGVIGGVLRDRTAERPLLGVNYLDLAGQRLGAVKGVLLTDSVDGKRPAVVRHGPAAAAGLLRGDVIVSVNGEDVTANNALSDLIAEYAPGSSVNLGVERNGAALTVDVTLGEVPVP